MASHYEDLEVWKEAIALVKMIYELTYAFPKEEMFGLTSQIRRSATSIPSNIAEGQQRDTLKDYLRYLSIAMGSHGELKTQLIIASELGYIQSNEFGRILLQSDKVGRMLRRLQQALKTKLELTP